jgi:hypothetical protein
MVNQLQKLVTRRNLQQPSYELRKVGGLIQVVLAVAVQRLLQCYILMYISAAKCLGRNAQYRISAVT